MQNEDLAPLQVALNEAAKAVLTLRAAMDQREARMSASFSQEMQSLRREVGQVSREVAAVVKGASSQIAQEAKEAVAPVAAQYDRAVTATSAQLQGANKMVWMWFGAAGTILLLVLLVGWALLGYYRRELATVKEELQRYENAVPVVQAFVASDAIICGGRICSNDDPNGQRAGDKRQYRQARPRPQR